MSDKASVASRARWAKTSPEERARVGALHRQAMKKWWATLSDAEKSARGKHMATQKYAKKD